MKKQIFTLTALLALTLHAIGQTPKLVEFPNVYLNPSTLTQRTITYKDEKSGVKDLQKISSLENYEQGWIFIPNYAKPDSSRWINVTKRMYATGWGFEVDTLQLEEIMKCNTHLIDYHFHPLSQILKDTLGISRKAKISADTLSKIDPEIDYKFLFDEGLENCFAEMTIPSPEDFVYMVDNILKYQKINPAGEIYFRLCSPLGITEYGLTQKGKECFKKIGRGDWFLLKKRNRSFFTHIYDLDINAVETAKNFTLQVSSDILTVNFKTYEEFYSPNNR